MLITMLLFLSFQPFAGALWCLDVVSRLTQTEAGRHIQQIAAGVLTWELG